MFVRRSGLAVAMLCAVPVFGAAYAQAHPEGGAGGCRQGSVMTGRLVPGTGSSGQSIHREAMLGQCASSLLPGIAAGRFDLTIPWNVTTATSVATFAWSDGSLSTATGYGNGLWLITGGPATGHAIQVNVADTWNGWYLSPADVTVTSADFVS